RGPRFGLGLRKWGISMTSGSRPLFASLALLAGLGLSSPSVRAQSAEVYAVDKGAGKILKIDFAASTVTTVNSAADAALRKQLEGILVRDDGADGINLVACDVLGGSVLFYHTANPGSETGQVITTLIPRPTGPSAAPNGDLYLLGNKKAGS